ncbi:PREDICTED: protein prune homolog isoform X2 [Dinoponera quadriceps]|uniref:Protein prune homolog isoform X2 n=1 Tax=Dinoponera quadriceps TaxID=609295 RepID=A0A6P3XET6_DINQU|nr:PREDICTED: protein prune homolog isoform X2 [Dinoponera quadriceps]
MESFLKASKVALSDLSPYQIIRVILGNQTCDLDSAVCALAQGFSEYVNAKKHGQSDLAVIPVLNIPEKEFRIKTEVVYWLRSHNIPLYLITFRDQINLQNLQNKTDKKLELILVDHHILPNEDIVLKPSVTNIIDHRPLDPAWSWSNILLNVEIVGSCTSLVARDILQKNPDMLDAQLASFLIGPILVDTYNMSAKGGRVTATDVDVINKLEQLGRLRTDRTENLLTRENAKEMIEKFGIDKNCTVIVLIGLDVSDGRISRDIAVFSILCDQLGNDIIQALTSSTQPPLNIDLVKEIREERYSICLYKIGNLEVTRKQILPIVQRTALLHNNERI